ncbi:hypothetical protein K491DRAFT_260726 [Lophiostoma macrostomum CBS 122681]|uniref:Uncharacterized protein n=1 Tax=Lophiostoma macrostomum CBS 122681 TaxID=1314788 RepID=A0A6A6SL02_9PLEO|nr:hypothetical protein K491DRAFT_260726 [Lophiostoma macrostomum CBS 122681]
MSGYFGRLRTGGDCVVIRQRGDESGSGGVNSHEIRAAARGRPPAPNVQLTSNHLASTRGGAHRGLPQSRSQLVKWAERSVLHFSFHSSISLSCVGLTMTQAPKSSHLCQPRPVPIVASRLQIPPASRSIKHRWLLSIHGNHSHVREKCQSHQ